MIKIIHPKIQTAFELSAEHPSLSVVVENPGFFSSIARDFIEAFDNEESEILFFNDDKEINAAKSGIIIDNVFRMGFDDKKNINALYKSLSADLFRGEMETEFASLNERVADFLHKITMNTSLRLESEPLDVSALFKAVDLRFKGYEDSLLESVLNYIQIFIELKKLLFVCFVNLRSFMNDEDIKRLERELSANGVYMLCLEGRNMNKTGKDERAIIITEDMSELFENF